MYVSDALAGYMCRFCYKAFSNKQNVRRHELIHTGEKPFSCECGRAFTQKAHLMRHYVTVHKTVPDEYRKKN